MSPVGRMKMSYFSRAFALFTSSIKIEADRSETSSGVSQTSMVHVVVSRVDDLLRQKLVVKRAIVVRKQKKRFMKSPSL